MSRPSNLELSYPKMWGPFRVFCRMQTSDGKTLDRCKSAGTGASWREASDCDNISMRNLRRTDFKLTAILWETFIPYYCACCVKKVFEMWWTVGVFCFSKRKSVRVCTKLPSSRIGKIPLRKEPRKASLCWKVSSELRDSQIHRFQTKHMVETHFLLENL